jgi:hypothetical protein
MSNDHFDQMATLINKADEVVASKHEAQFVQDIGVLAPGIGISDGSSEEGEARCHF